MAAAALDSNKAKIAKRVIEVLEFFGACNQPATVMDIARRYGRPQSSTSELLSSLVEMGLLYKDAASRSFTPTPRLATLGMSSQPGIIRDGRLFNYMDRLAQTTRETVALFGLVGTHVQAFRWIAAPRAMDKDIGCGSSELLSASTAGLLLLSTLTCEQSKGMLWRLNAEAPAEAKFDHAEMVGRVARFRRQGHASGEAGFIPGAQVSAVLLPRTAGDRPLALGVLYPAAALDADVLVETVMHGVSQIFSMSGSDAAGAVRPFVRAI